jgi:hypothetical protein
MVTALFHRKRYLFFEPKLRPEFQIILFLTSSNDSKNPSKNQSNLHFLWTTYNSIQTRRKQNPQIQPCSFIGPDLIATRLS